MTSSSIKGGKWLRLMMVNATFSNISAYIVTVSFIGGGNRNSQKKNIVLPQVTDKLYHIMLYRDILDIKYDRGIIIVQYLEKIIFKQNLP
jgi:hypothetical protein